MVFEHSPYTLILRDGNISTDNQRPTGALFNVPPLLIPQSEQVLERRAQIHNAHIHDSTSLIHPQRLPLKLDHHFLHALTTIARNTPHILFVLQTHHQRHR